MSAADRHRMRSLLADTRGDVDVDVDDDFLIPPHQHELAEAIGWRSAELPAGTRIGPYEILELIARGGMGAVYRARRADDAYEKQVAIKIIRGGIASTQSRRRFHAERQALAQLDHPNITRLHDGGETRDGLPYLVMEYIKGRPIDEYCHAQQMSVRQRLELFRRACDAVQYAHRNLIVHRDLKPGNILVTDEGCVKLVDFGISRLLEEDTAGESRHTVTQCRAMTPAYASPEQIRGDLVTTSADVYALGVVLYELLSGRQPYELKGLPPYEAERLVCETSAPAPSTAAERTTDVHRLPGDVSPAQLSRTLSGDLDTIVLMAMRHDPVRRYASVEQLSEDVRRYLAGLPVLARKDTLAYRTIKFVGRNRPHVIAAGVAVIAVLAAFIGITFGLIRARQAHHTAEMERISAVAARGDAEEALSFYRDMLATANPYRSGGPVSVLNLLEQTEHRIGEELNGKPEVEAGVRLAMAHNYASLMMWERAQFNAERALALYREHRDPDDPVLGDCLTLLGRAQVQLNRPGAIDMQLEALAIRRNAFGDEHEMVAETIGSLGYALWSAAEGVRQWNAAERRYHEAIAMLERIGKSDGRIAARLTMSLGFMYQCARRPALAERQYQRALAIYEGIPVGEDMYELTTVNLYSRLLERLGRIEEAVRMARAHRELLAADIQREKLLYASWRLACLNARLGEHTCVVEDCRQAVALECELLAEQPGQDADQLRRLAAELRDPDVRAHPEGTIARAVDALGSRRIARKLVCLGVLPDWSNEL